LFRFVESTPISIVMDKLPTFSFFRKQAGERNRAPTCDTRGARPVDWRVWRPSHRRLWPAQAEPISAVWGVMHLTHIFRNGEYGQILGYCDGTLVHRSYVFPGWFRFPFMNRIDVQIGDTWTSPDHRGRGMATAAICRVVAEWDAPDRAFWYVVASDNTPSVRAIQRAGFTLVGVGERRSRWGCRLLGSFMMEG
jgi:RimJ/RimL family protein N-acetyltransferase